MAGKTIASITLDKVEPGYGCPSCSPQYVKIEHWGEPIIYEAGWYYKGNHGFNERYVREVVYQIGEEE